MPNREQLLAAVRRGRPERVPYTYTAEKETDALLRAHLGLAKGETVERFFGCNVFSTLWDVLGAPPRLPERERRNAMGDRNTRVDIWGCKYARAQAGSVAHFELARSPLANAETVADVERYDWPKPEEVVWPERPRGVSLGDRVVLEMSWIGPFGIAWSVRGMERLMMDLVLAPAVAEAIVAKIEEYTLGCLAIALEKYGGLIDLIGSGDDYGAQNGLLLSKDHIDRFFMPSVRRHYALGRKHGTVGYHHCCGAIFDIIPSFIDAGVEVLNPIQTSATGMDPVRLKREFGSALAFHGGMDIQQTLRTGSPDQVRGEVRSRMDTLGPAGFILAPSHLMQPDIPAENVVAMYEEARRYGAVT